MKGIEKGGFVLGIDLGSNSLGWAVLKPGGGKRKGEVVAIGSRAFDAGLDNLEQDGKGLSPNVERRDARLARRGVERRTRRLVKLVHILQGAGLMPEGEVGDGESRHEYLAGLDKRLEEERDSRSNDSGEGVPCAWRSESWPYRLRARALDERLSPHELGRALYHLAHRRGFLSNRKSPPKKDEERSTVKKGISDLDKRISETGSRTLGEFFSRVDPREERIRDRYTSRAMYEDEFEKIWEAQKARHPGALTDDLYQGVRHAIFHQRPLKSQKHLVGRCELEKGRRRAPWALLLTQRFRFFQTVNNLRVEEDGMPRGLTADERSTLLEALETGGDMTFAAVRRFLGIKRGIRFNLERGGEKRLTGNRTAAKLGKVFGDKWNEMGEEKREAVVEDVRSIVKDETLKRRAMRVWELDEERADMLAAFEPEDGYCSFSVRAIEKLMPGLEDGVMLQTAIRDLYPERWERAARPLDELPPVRSEAFGEIRNPIVERSLTELRGVVNHIIKRHGKPEMIRVELARELRQPARQREAACKRMRKNENDRKKAAKRITDEAGIENPSRVDVLKFLLADECNWRCPYTGRSISMKALVGAHPQFEIEHIIPHPRSLDDSYMNKTLCWAAENRVKHNKTPFEAYSGTGKWDGMIARVKDFKGAGAGEKLRRFMLDEKGVEELIDGFISRQLNDTRYATRRAKEYLGLLYGGINDDGIDTSGTRRVHAVTGQLTARLRALWGLNSILGYGPGKSRDDHRHHAVDAIVTALADPSKVKLLGDAAGRAEREKRRLFAKVKGPWEGFRADVLRAVYGTVTSHRVSRRVRGPLHRETFYGRPSKGADGRTYVHIRKPLTAISKKNIDAIADHAVRERVREKLDELGGDPKKFADPENLPYIEGGGNRISIRSVRLRVPLETFTVGKGHGARHVQSDRNHHMEIIEVTDKKGREKKWDASVVSMYEACGRLKRGEPIVKRDHGKGTRFLFSLAGGEVIELDDDDGTRGLYVVRTITQFKQKGRLYNQIKFVPVNDARKLDEIKKDKMLGSGLPDPLRKRGCRKVVITPLGEVRYAND